LRCAWLRRRGALPLHDRFPDLRTALRAPCRSVLADLRRAIQLAAVVGTILFFINQSDVVLNGQVTWLVVAKIVLTYLVPLSVSMYSALAASRGRS
jgi:hypothetical protein